MNSYTTKATAALLALAVALPSVASAQLSYSERERAKEMARIQARADANQRREDQRRDSKRQRTACFDAGRHWDSVTETCRQR